MSHFDPDVVIQVALGTSLIGSIAVLGVLCRAYIRGGDKLAGLGFLVGTLLVCFWLIPTFLSVTNRMLE